MMKSFFKKLAFVMALAMVVSMVAPAGSALAADAGVSLQGTKTIVTTYELDKAGATVDFSFQGAPKDWKTTFAWTSDNTAVATVDKAGIVTAVAAGTATITITAGADASYKHSVVVTVKEAATATAFEVKQTSTNTATLTFNVPAAGVTVDTLEVIWLISDLEIEMSKKSVTVNENVATVELNDNFIDGGNYIFRYDNKDVKYTASLGEIARVGFSWYTDDEKTGAGKAFVSTDDEPATTVLVPHFYDANNVDVTGLYDTADFEITYALATESDSYELNDNELTFNGISQAVINMTVAWQDDEGNDKTLYGVNAVVGVKRPAVQFTVLKSGFMKEGAHPTDDDDNIDCLTDFTTNPESLLWKNNMYTNTWIIGDEGGDDVQAAALVKDNRGNTIVTGVKAGDNVEEGEYPFGSFIFASSKETVLGVDEEGYVSFYDPGKASILIYFVPIDAEDVDAEKVLIGAIKTTVKAERYPATYKMIADSSNSPVAPKKTGEEDEDGNAIYAANELNAEALVTLQVFDQYGDSIWVDPSTITVEANSKTNDVVPNVGGDCWWCWRAPGCHYHITAPADDFADQVKSSSSKSFKYTVTVDKDTYENLTTKSDTFTYKMTNVNSYYTNSLQPYLASVDAEAGVAGEDINGKELETFHYSGVTNSSNYVDLGIKNIINWGNTYAQDVRKGADIWLNYRNSSSGIDIMGVPADNIVPLKEVEEGKWQTTGLAGVIYYRETTTSNKLTDDANKGGMTITVNNGNIHLTWIESHDDEGNFVYAPTGTYKLTLYTAKENGGKLSAKTYTYTVKNSQDKVLFAGCDAELGNVNDEVTYSKDGMSDADIKTLITDNLEFTLEGRALDLKEMDNIVQIYSYEMGAQTDKSATIKSVTFKVRVDNPGSNEWYLTDKIKVGRTIREK